LLHISDDPNSTSKAAVGDSLVSDSKLFFSEALKGLNEKKNQQVPKRTVMGKEDRAAIPMLPHAVLEVLHENSPKDIVLVEECPSIVPLMQDVFRINTPDTYYTFASGCLGWGLPASVGLALGEVKSGRNRPVISLMGDGSFQYSIQAIYTGVQQKAHVIYVVFQNEEYGILKQFATLEETPNVPGLDLPGLDIVSQGKGYGANTMKVESLSELKDAYLSALAFKGTSVIVVPITKDLKPLFGQA
jgi:benzoylformate decarboxylase